MGVPNPTDDGSMEAAMAAFPAGFDDDETPSQEATAAAADPAKDPVKSAADAEVSKKEDPAEDDDWLEMQGEEGKDPERYRLSEVWEGYQRSKTLEAELAKAREVQPMAEEVQTQVRQTMQERQNYIAALNQWQAMNQPKQPDIELLNEASAAYNPPAYYKAVQDFQTTVANQRKVQDELTRLQAIQTEQAEALSEATFARERTRLLQIWPEMKDEATAVAVRSDLQKHYGIDRATLAEVIDSRFYAVAKDALAYRAQQAKQAEAVKVVRAKPKLIPGGARSSSNGQAARSGDAIEKLRKSGTFESAMAALDDFKSFQ